MPKSRVRQKAVYTPPPSRAKAKVSPRWLVPTMLACLLVGLAWIALYYVTGGKLPIESLGAWFVVSRRLKVDVRAIVFLIVLNLALPFVVGGIAWQAHVGGLLTGALVTAAYAYAPRERRTLVQVGATVLVAAVLVVALITRNHQILTSALG